MVLSLMSVGSVLKNSVALTEKADLENVVNLFGATQSPLVVALVTLVVSLSI